MYGFDIFCTKYLVEVALVSESANCSYSDQNLINSFLVHCLSVRVFKKSINFEISSFCKLIDFMTLLFNAVFLFFFSTIVKKALNDHLQTLYPLL
jgi:hypothetical protein